MMTSSDTGMFQMPLNRNTINQRASRARKKDYVSSLELKIRDYEAQGVHATEKVQSAARHVAEENRVLKEEVRVLREQVRCLEEVLRRRDTLFGSGSDPTSRLQDLDAAWRDIQAENRQRRLSRRLPDWELQGHKTESTLVMLDADGDDDLEHHYPSPPESALEKSGPQFPDRGAHRRHQRSDSDFLSPLRHGASYTPNVPSQTTTLTTTTTANHVPWQWQPTLSEEQRQSRNESTPPPQNRQKENQPPSAPSSICASHPPINAANTTPCEEAALIIASMRGLPPNTNHHTEILPELGCYTSEQSRACSVDNARLFRIMDADTHRQW